MTTVARILALALKDAGITGEGETASAETLLDAFDTLKMMVAQWAVDGLMVYARSEVSFGATGAESYTLGPSGDVVTTRPANVDAAFWRRGGVDIPLEVLPAFEEYQNIDLKTIVGVPQYVSYNPTNTNGTLYVWPQPNTGTIVLTVLSPLPSYATTAEELTVPAEYELALRYSLAEMLPSVFQVAPRPDIAGMARRARTVLKRNNTRVPELGMPFSVAKMTRFNIFSGR